MSSARISTTNSTTVNLLASQSFFGTKDIVGEFTKCGVSVFADQTIALTVTQSQNGVNADKVDVYIITASTSAPPFTEFASPRISVEMSHKYVTITARNTSATTATTFCRIETQVYNEGFLTHTHDNVKLFGTTADGVHKAVLTNADGALIVSGGGGGDASQWATFPAVANVDLDEYDITNVNNISADIVATDILKGYKNSPLGSILVQNNLDMDGKSITGANFLSANTLTSPNNTDLSITSSQVLSLYSVDNISIQTESLDKDPNTLEFSNLGNLTFSEGEQNINNLLGVTHSQGFTLTQNGGGVITFEDGTTMATAGGGGSGGNFSTPSTVDLDMDSHKIINITQLGGVGAHYNPIIVNNDITFAGTPEFGSASQMTNLEYLYGNVDNGLTITNVATVSTGNLATDLLIISPTVILSENLRFNNDATIQTTAYQNPFQTQLDLNGNSVIRTQQIFGDNDMIFTAGMTNTSESSTLSLTNNGYAVAGTYSQLFLKPTGVELNTGDITASTDFKATLDTAGVFSAPKFKVTALEGTEGLDMNTTGIINAIQINSAPATNINIDGIDADSQVVINANTSGIGGTSTLSVAPAGIFLNTLITGTEDTATASFLPQSGTFIAPFFEAQGLQLTGAPFQKGSISAPLVNNVDTITFSDLTGQTTAYTGNDVKTITSTDGSVVITTPSANTVNLSVPTPQGITSNTFFVNDNVNNINDVLPLMGTGDIAIISAGTFGQATDITWNVAQTGLSGSVAPAPLSFLTTANASRFTVTATQVRIANIKFQLPVFLSGSNCVVDNCDFDSAITIGTNVTGFITLNNCEFGNTPVITVASTFTNILYFINCNFGGATLTLSQASASQVIFNNCAGFTTYPANGTYVGINVLSAGSAQLSTTTMKSVTSGGTIKFLSNIDMDGNSTINCNNIGGRTGDPVTFTNGLELQTGGGAFNMRSNTLFNVGTMTQILSGSSTVTTQGSATATRFLQTVTIPSFTGGASATYVYNDLGTLSLKNVTLTTGGIVTFPDATTQNTAYTNLDVQTITNTDGMLTITAPTTHGVTIQSAMKKGTATLTGSGGSPQGSYFISDTTVTANCVCVATYADAPPNNGVLSAIVTAGSGILIQSHLVSDVSPFFYMYFI